MVKMSKNDLIEIEICFLGVLPSEHKQMLFVCTAHIHWDPEYCDVKVVQTLMLLSELKTIMEEAIQKHRTSSNALTDCASVPLVLCGDFNSLPDSGKTKNQMLAFS
jgi:CCR4-NOT transcription complex subunit 6